MSDDPEKPRPKRRAISIHDLRGMVSSRHKVLASSGPVEDAVKLIQDEHHADDASCLAFVLWLRGESPGQPPEAKQAIERIHVVADPRTGDQRYVDTQPGSIPPRPVGGKPPGR
ncbi:MAG: hypothetical protein KF878_08390 [Planctomycetes bacterium]|nr:hypothetical protein [Planctomycetota bacterium]